MPGPGERDTRFGGNLESANAGIRSIQLPDSSQYRLPSFNEGRGGRGNYQGDSMFTAPIGVVNEIPMGRYPGLSLFYDVDKPYRQEAGLREQPTQQGITAINRGMNKDFMDKIQQILAQQAGDFRRGRRTPDDIRQNAINMGQKAGLGNRISFAGEGGEDILNPSEMSGNAPSVSEWKQEAQRKMIMDMYDERFNNENPYYGQPEPDYFAEADSYSPQNLIQMLQDARDAGNEDEADMLYNDLEMRFPTLAGVDEDNAAVRQMIKKGFTMEEIMKTMAARPVSA